MLNLIGIIQREWAEAKKELQEERDNVRALTLDRERTIKNAMRQVEEMGKELANALHAVAAAESRAAIAEVFINFEKLFNLSVVFFLKYLLGFGIFNPLLSNQ